MPWRITIVETIFRERPHAGREQKSPINDFRHCAMPYSCSHGRTKLIEELKKKFGRMA